MDICGREGLYMPEGECECPGGGDVTILAYTYSQVKALRDNGELIPGQQYRIKDYEATTTQEGTSVIANSFDIILTADNATTLNENARAVKRTHGSYYDNADLTAWEIKYTVDNDTERFGWADATNGKGVIYYMKDEYDNIAPYDFKQIVFARYQIDGTAGHQWFADMFTTQASAEQFPDVSEVEDFTVLPTPVYMYTFTDHIDGLVDASVVQNRVGCFENHLESLHDEIHEGDVQTRPTMFLPDIVFWTEGDQTGYTGSALGFSRNTIGAGSYNCTFGTDCHNNNIGEECHDITTCQKFLNNTIDDWSYNMWFAYNVCDNDIGTSCHTFVWDNTNGNNVVGPWCANIMFDPVVSDNVFGPNCSDIHLGNYSGGNVFGTECRAISMHQGGRNTVGNGCYQIVALSGLHDTHIGNECGDILFKGTVGDTSFGNKCRGLNIDGNVEQCTFEDGVSYIDLENNSSPVLVVRNYYFLTGTSGTYSNHLVIDGETSLAHTLYVAKDSNGNLEIWNPADGGVPVGAPVIVNSVSAMTDTSKIYLYTGSEAGYTAGDWYYWDGTAWVSGGVYGGSSVVIDDTLTRAGEAADAKATGDEIAELKSDINEVTEYKNLFDASSATDDKRLLPYTDGGGLYTQSGYYTSDFIAVEVGSTYTKNSPVLNAYHRFCYYDSDKVCLGNLDDSNSITIQSGTAWIRFCGLSTEKSTAVLCKGNEVKTYTAIDNEARKIASGLENQSNYLYYASLAGLHNKIINQIKTSDITYGTGANKTVQVGDTLNTFTWATGYYSHNIIPVNEYDILYITYRALERFPHVIYCDANMVVIGIDDNTVGTSSSVVFTDRQIIAPKGCSYVVVFSQSQAAPNTGTLNIFKKMIGYYLDEYVNYVSDAPALRNGSVSATRTDTVACNNIIPINGAKSIEIHCNKTLDEGHSIEYWWTTYAVSSGLTLGATGRIRIDQLLPADAEGKATLHFNDGENGFAFSIRELDENGTAVDPLRWYDFQKNDVFYIMNYFSDLDKNAPDFIEDSVSNVLNNMTGQDGNTLNLAFITDLHVTAFAELPLQQIKVWKRNANGLACVDESRNIDFVVLGGDYLWNNANTTLARAEGAYKLLQECFYKFKEKQFALKGNHDDNSIANNTDYIVTDSMRYGYLGQQYTNTVNIKYGNAEKSYGYIDFKRQKVRALFINTVDIPSYTGQHITGVSNTQLNFFADALNISESGWALVVFSHHVLVNNATMALDSEAYLTPTHGGDALWGIIQAFKDRTTYTKVSTLTDYEYSVNVDYRNNGSSEVIACINGHTHRDLSATQDGILLISTTASGFGQDAYDSEGNEITQTIDTVSETSYDIYSVDRINRTIKTSRYGAGQNRNWSY